MPNRWSGSNIRGKRSWGESHGKSGYRVLMWRRSINSWIAGKERKFAELNRGSNIGGKQNQKQLFAAQSPRRLLGIPSEWKRQVTGVIKEGFGRIKGAKLQAELSDRFVGTATTKWAPKKSGELEFNQGTEQRKRDNLLRAGIKILWPIRENKIPREYYRRAQER